MIDFFLTNNLYKQALVQNGDDKWTHTWYDVEGGSLLSQGATVTSILGDFHELPKIFLSNDDYTVSERDIGLFSNPSSVLLQSFFFSGLLVADLNYGLGKAKWDSVAETAEGLNALLSGFRIVTTANFHTVVLYVSLAMVGMAEKVMLANGYVHIQQLPWFKPGHNLTGSTYVLIPSIGEVLLIGLSGASAVELNKKYINWDKNPLKRPNLLVCPTVAQRKVDARGAVINPHEKPSAIMSYLAPKLCLQGAQALVAGSGAFGDIMGLNAIGLNVYGIENDPDQFKQTAILIPTLKLVNQADLVIPLEEVNSRLAKTDVVSESDDSQIVCCRCLVVIKDARDSIKCVDCGDEYICLACLPGFSESAPKCKTCGAIPEASIAATEGEEGSEASSSHSSTGA